MSQEQAAAKQQKRNAHIDWQTILVNGFLIIVGLLFIFPVFYALMTSFREPGYGLTKEIIPRVWYFGNYDRLFNYGRFPRYVLNSIINALGGAVLTSIVAALAGYAFARFEFWGKRMLMFFVLAVMMLPQITNLIPLYKMASDLKLLNTYIVMIVILGGYGVPLGIWTMKGFFESIPVALEEAAAIDGASPFQTLWRVVIPISAPGLLATFLINFVYNWNNFITPLFMLTKTEMKTATVGLYDFQHALEGNQDELLAAACVIIMAPAIALFIGLRRYFLEGMVEGAVKG
ncbi:MAG: ABC transporter permease subunit [Chloroflexi bacterium]|jgi:ABC-type glycerol-3-phosphate transport system permease component|nr:ABC transporter permease subunit [Chloroflexota bacterium]